MKVVLFGGNGFIGEYLQKTLLTLHHEVTVIGANTPPSDIDFQAEVIVILTQPNGPVEKDLFPKLPQFVHLKKIVYLSTLLLYPDSSVPQPEWTSVQPMSEYERNKASEENKLIEYCNVHSLQLCIARLGNVYGDIRNRGVIHRMFRFILHGESFSIFGDASAKVKDFIFVEDVAKGVAFLIGFHQTQPVEIFNVCTGVGHSLADVMKEIEVITGHAITYIQESEREEKQSNVGDNTKILHVWGLGIEYSLTHGLKKAWENYRASSERQV